MAHPNVNPVNVNAPAAETEACIAPGASVIAAMRAALTFTSKAGRSPALLPAQLDLDDATLLASLAESIAAECEKIAKVAKTRVLDIVPAGEAHEVKTPAGTVKALVVKGYERRSDDYKAACEGLRAALRLAAGDLLQAGRPVESARAAHDAATPAPVKVTQVGPSVRLS